MPLTATETESSPITTIDEVIDRAYAFTSSLPSEYDSYRQQLVSLRDRLGKGRLHLAVIGQFNRGKSTFINALLGMELLPVSIVPLTSVPTYLEYAPSLSCTIRFFNGNPPRIVRENRDTITETIITYSTEKHNSKNWRCVKEAVVTCPSDLLKNGTVLIDTPGFGSTYTHNTTTTINLLRECDAALFLFSVDNPVSHHELAFLKEVFHCCPRVFFIINKIDLASPHERELSESFVRSTISSTFDIPDVRLFPLSSRNTLARQSTMESSGNHDNSSSGIDCVKGEIIDFLLREKFFTLSEALSSKLKETLEASCTALSRREKDIEEARSVLENNGDALTAGITHLRDTLETESRLFDKERTALCSHVETCGRKLFSLLTARLETFIDSLLEGNTSPVQAMKNAKTSIDLMLQQLYERFCLSLATTLNKPLRKTGKLHLDTLRSTHKRLSAEVHETPPLQAGIAEAISTEEITGELMDYDLQTTNRIVLTTPGLRLRLQGRSRLREYIRHNAVEHLQGELRLVTNDIVAVMQRKVTTQLQSCHDILNRTYHDAITSLESSREQAKLKAESSREKTESELSMLVSVRKNLETLLSTLP